MTTNKERIENLEASVGGMQDQFSRMEVGLVDRMLQLETQSDGLQSP